MVSPFETAQAETRPVAAVLGDDWVEVEPGIYSKRVDMPPAVALVADPEPYSPFSPAAD